MPSARGAANQCRPVLAGLSPSGCSQSLVDASSWPLAIPGVIAVFWRGNFDLAMYRAPLLPAGPLAAWKQGSTTSSSAVPFGGDASKCLSSVQGCRERRAGGTWYPRQ